jgi:hypothetical protein
VRGERGNSLPYRDQRDSTESGSRKRRERGRSETEQHTAHQRNPGYSLNAKLTRQPKVRQHFGLSGLVPC